MITIDTQTLVELAVLLLSGAVFVCVAARVVFSDYFQQKLTYHRTLLAELKEGADDESKV